MKPETEEWVNKAEGDLKVAQREMQTVDPVRDVVCFLSEQCAEKYLKAFLEEHNIAFGKSHDLVNLLNTSAGMLQELEPQKPALAQLSTFGISARYPGMTADRQATEEAIKTARQVRALVREKLGLR